MNSLLWQGGCVALLIACVLWNRSEVGDPRWPLLGLGLTLFLWLLLGIYVIVAGLWYGNSSNLYSTLLGAIRVDSSILPVVSCVVAFIPIVLWVSLIVSSQRVPSIHDITTDMNQPPPLTLAESNRHPSHNSVVYANKNISQQRTAYPEVKPLIVALPPEKLMPIVINAVSDLGWQLHHPLEEKVGMLNDHGDLLIEAYDKTALLGFVDDIVVRVRAINEGSQIDIRSASRIGQSDFGVNAQRIQAFLKVINHQTTVVQ
ncbi:DUF1499 domain-containing protein [Eionea flava]